MACNATLGDLGEKRAGGVQAAVAIEVGLARDAAQSVRPPEGGPHVLLEDGEVDGEPRVEGGHRQLLRRFGASELHFSFRPARRNALLNLASELITHKR